MKMRRLAFVVALIVAGSLVTTARASTDTATIAFSSNRDGDSDIYVMDADGGNVRQLTNDPGADLNPAWSPDGRQIAFASNRDGDYEIFVMDDDGSGVRQLTFTDGSGVDHRPAWSPDGREIVFDRPCVPSTGLHLDLYTARLDGAPGRRLTNAACGGSGGAEAGWAPQNQIVMQRFVGCCSWDVYKLDPAINTLVRLTTSGAHDLHPVWFPGGSSIAWTSQAAGSWDIWKMASNGSAQVRLTTSAASDVSPAVSCDGQTIVFASDRDGNSEIYSMTATGANQIRLTNHAAGDSAPDWRCLRNAAPVPTDDSFSTDEDATLDVPAPGVLGNDVELDGDPVTVAVTVPPSYGTLDLRADGSFTYVPDPNYNEPDSFGYVSTDPYGATGTGTVSLSVLAVNDAPVATADAVSTPQYQAVMFDAVANDTDIDGDVLFVVSVTEPAHGDASFDGGTITFDPDQTFKDADSFTYTVSDGAGGISEATVTITEIGCGEDGLDTLDGTPLEGGASRTIDREVEPALGGIDRDAAEVVHDSNCTYVVTAEETLEGS